MNKEYAKMLLQSPKFKAFAEGQKVEWRRPGAKDWNDLRWWNFGPHLDWTDVEIRIKPTPKLRPWKDNSEVPLLATVRIKSGQAGFSNAVALITGINSKGEVFIGGVPDPKMTMIDMFERCECKPLGTDKWLPCGIVEDSQ